MKKNLLLPLILIAILASGISTLFIVLSQPVDRNDTKDVVFVVAPGEGISAIGKELEKEGLIRNRFIFLLAVKRLGLEGKIQAGDFRLQKNKTPEEIAKQLTTGTLDIWVQIIEGWRAEEIAQLFKEKLPNYDDSWVLALRKNEGHLFPDTYLIPRNADIDVVISIFTNNFTKRVQAVSQNVGHSALSLDDALILASIVER